MTGLIGKKSCKKQKKNIPKKMLSSTMHKTKKLYKKSQWSVIKTCHKEKKTRLKSIKEKVSKTGSV